MLIFSPDFLCMQANPSVLIYRSDAGLLFLTAHEIQHPNSIMLLVFLLKMLDIATHLKHLLHLKILTIFNPDVIDESQEEMLHSDLLLHCLIVLFLNYV